MVTKLMKMLNFINNRGNVNTTRRRGYFTRTQLAKTECDTAFRRGLWSMRVVGVQIEQLRWKTIWHQLMLLNNRIARNSTRRYISERKFRHVHRKTCIKDVANSTICKRKQNKPGTLQMPTDHRMDGLCHIHTAVKTDDVPQVPQHG